MPVFNGGALLHRALQSILDQTFTDFEIIVVDDGSTDGTEAYLRSILDPRLRVVRLARTGLTGALNAGLHAARGDYIARQDADDRAHPLRLAEQVAYLDQHPEAALVGAQAATCDPQGRPLGVIFHPVNPASIRWRLLFDSPIVHPAVMFRRTVVVSLGGYGIHGAEDYDLWSRIGRKYGIANLPNVLITYTISPQAQSDTNRVEIQGTALEVSVANIVWMFGANRWAAHARAIARLQREPAQIADGAIEPAVCALLELRRLFLARWDQPGQTAASEPLKPADKAYIDFYVWRLIATVALLHAAPQRLPATLRLWVQGRFLSPSRARSAALFALLIFASTVGGTRMRWLLDVALRILALRNTRILSQERSGLGVVHGRFAPLRAALTRPGQR